MLEESERLTQLVDGLLVLIRESTEVYRARFAPVDVGELAGEVVELLRALAEEKDQRLDLVVDGVAVAQVTDTGPGIAEEHCEKVFDRFYRIDDARSRSTGGAGLGLAIARWAVELNGGLIELESKPGKGSAFCIRLPRASESAPPPVEGTNPPSHIRGPS